MKRFSESGLVALTVEQNSRRCESVFPDPKLRHERFWSRIRKDYLSDTDYGAWDKNKRHPELRFYFVLRTQDSGRCHRRICLI